MRTGDPSHGLCFVHQVLMGLSDKEMHILDGASIPWAAFQFQVLLAPYRRSR